MTTTLSNRARTGKIIDDLEEVKRITMRLLVKHGKINAGMIWSAGKVSYSNAQKAIDALETEGKIFRQPENGDEDTFWK